MILMRKEKAKKDPLLACVLVGEHLSERKEQPTFYIRERAGCRRT